MTVIVKEKSRERLTNRAKRLSHPYSLSPPQRLALTSMVIIASYLAIKVWLILANGISSGKTWSPQALLVFAYFITTIVWVYLYSC